LAKDTSTHLHELSNGVSTLTQSEQRQWRLQRERLQNDFTKALNTFQEAQRTAATKEREVIKKAKSAAGFPSIGGPNQGKTNLLDLEEGQAGGQHTEEQQRKQQMLMQEEIDVEQLHERERSIRQLEVMKPIITIVYSSI
jgi:syntaxin 7